MLRGKAPLTTIRLSDGRRANLHAGAIAPEDIDPDDAKRLVKDGFLEKVKIAAAPQVTEPQSSDQGGDEGEGSGDEPKAPAKSASKDEWVAYATDEARGEHRLEVEDAEALKRDQLAELFG